jgi:hypothetical protein
MSEAAAEVIHIENAFGTVTDRRIIYFRSKGWFSDGSKEVISLQRVTSVRFEISRPMLLAVPLLLLGLILLRGNGVLGRVNTTKRFDDQGKIDEGDKHHIEFVESREYAPESLQSPEQSLDLVASLVHRAIVLPCIDSVALGRNHGNEVQIQRQLPRFVSLVRTIHEQMDRPLGLAQLAQ